MVHPAIPPSAHSPNLLNGLVAKRAEIAGRLQANHAEHLRLTVDLKVVDDTIRLFEPEVDLSAIAPKPVKVEHAAAFGEVTRFVYEALRGADCPLTSMELTHILMRRRGLDPADERLARLVRCRVGACLAAKRDRGFVVSVPLTGRKLAWRLAYAG